MDVFDRKSRYGLGFSIQKHRGVFTKTTVGNSYQDNLLEDINTRYEYKVGFVPAGFEHRPDLISYVFYDTPAYWWLLMSVNNITDPFEGFNTNDRILIPQL